jgi:protocatechuate 3,4-dioxygenase beta subunit
MRAVLLAAVWLCLVLAVGARAQNAQAPSRPGGVVGTPTPGQPGLPPRDTAQKPQTGTAKIRGRVLAAVTNAPLRRVQLSLASPDMPQGRITTTDAEGRYEFRNLPASRFSLSASKPGYVSLQYGQRRPYEAGTPVALREGETITSIDFALPRGAVITGRLLDEFGEPMARAEVEAQRSLYTPDGQRRFSTTASDTTDDRGEFRLYGLMPGEYVVRGSVRTFQPFEPINPDDLPQGYPGTFYPGTLNVAEAVPVTLGIGEEANVQFGLIAARLLRISGTIRDSQGRPLYPAQVGVMPPLGPGMIFFSSGPSFVSTNPDGSFTIRDVAPGEYIVEVRPQPAGGRPSVSESASMPITVAAADVAGLTITTSRGAVVSGKVVWEGTSPRMGTGQSLNRPEVTASPADGGLPPSFFGVTDPDADGSIDDDGSFRLGGVAGRVLFDVSASPAWDVKSVMFEGRNITEVPFDVTGRPSIDGVQITLTDKLTTVSGHVTDSRGAAVTSYLVVILPAEERTSTIGWYRYIRSTRSDINGRFETRGMPPGRYVATAVESLESGRQFVPAVQAQLRKGAREFSLKEGESLTLDLRLTAAP